MKNNRMKAVFPLLVLVMGAMAAILLAKSRKAPETTTPPELAPLVETLTVHHSSLPAVVLGHGTLRPRHVVQVVPQVAGQVVRIHEAMVGGGTFRRGDLLVEIDPRDFELAVRKNEAELARAEVRLETERAEAVIARDEWGRLHPDEAPSSPLVVREPQIKQAEAELAAAQANVDRSRLDLERTSLRAPFDGRVEDERLEVGQFLVVGQSVATLHGTRRLEVPVPLEDRELAWFSVGDSCTIEVQYAGASHEWLGRVVRVEGVDPATRMVTIVAEIDRGQSDSGGKPDLLPGMFAEVSIYGTLEDGVPIPRSVLREGERVWLLDDEGRLRIQDVQVGRTGREQVLVVAGLEEGARLVTTHLDAVTDGMAVRAEKGQSADGDDS